MIPDLEVAGLSDTERWEALLRVIELLMRQDQVRGEQIRALQDDVRALSNRIESVHGALRAAVEKLA